MSAARVARWVVVAALFMAVSSFGQPNGGDRARAFAALPNWTGIWIADDGVMNALGLSGRPANGQIDNAKKKLNAPLPYNAEWAAKVEAERKNPVRAAAGKECGFPFPFMMESPWVMQFLITPEETAVILAGREIRHLYTDGRLHPKAEDLWATPWGDSVGRWDGPVLIADTIAVQTGFFPPMLSERAHFTERIRMASPDRIEDELTIDDPAALTRAWTVTIPYQRVAGMDRMVHGDCGENDRNPVVDGQLTIAPTR